jgi:hypothetical protein
MRAKRAAISWANHLYLGGNRQYNNGDEAGGALHLVSISAGFYELTQLTPNWSCTHACTNVFRLEHVISAVVKQSTFQFIGSNCAVHGQHYMPPPCAT